MKFVLIISTIVTFGNGGVDHSSSHTKMIPTQFSNLHQCEYNGERYIEREMERMHSNLQSNKSVAVDFQCSKID